MQTYILTHTYTFLHIHMCFRIPIHTYTCIYTCIYVYICTQKHVHSFTQLHAHTYAFVHGHVHTFPYVFRHRAYILCLYIGIHALTHSFVYIHVCIHTRIRCFKVKSMNTRRNMSSWSTSALNARSSNRQEQQAQIRRLHHIQYMKKKGLGRGKS